MVTASVMLGSSKTGVIVLTSPVLESLKLMVSLPGASLAAVIASRRVHTMSHTPLPGSAVVVLGKVGFAWGGRGHREEDRIAPRALVGVRLTHLEYGPCRENASCPYSLECVKGKFRELR